MRAKCVQLAAAGLIAPNGEIRNRSGVTATSWRVCQSWPADGKVAVTTGSLAAAREEIVRLRELCVSHGIDPDPEVGTPAQDLGDIYLDVLGALG